jgi:hypothetical protein
MFRHVIKCDNYRKLCLTNPRKGIALYKSTRILVAYSKKQSLCANYIVSRQDELNITNTVSMNVEFDVMIIQHQLCLLYSFMYLMGPTSEAARSEARVRGRSLAGIVGSNPGGDMDSVSWKCCVLSGRGLCEGLVTRPEESHRM